MTLIYARIGGEVNPEWLEARRGKLTASEAGRLMGSPKVRQTYLIEKLTERLTGEIVGRGETPAMRHGIETEDEAGSEYEMRTGRVLVPGYWIERDGLGCTPDFLVDDDGVVEIKCLQAKTVIAERFGHLLSDKGGPAAAPPRDYWWQCQAVMAVTERAWCDFPYYTPQFWRHPDLTFWSRRIERDDKNIAALWEAVRRGNELLDEAAEMAAGEYGWVERDIIPAIRAAGSFEDIQKVRNDIPAVRLPDHIGVAIDLACAERLEEIGGIVG